MEYFGPKNGQVRFNCENCNKLASTFRHEYDKTNHHYCSNSCSITVSNKNRPSLKNKFKKINCITCNKECDAGVNASIKLFSCVPCRKLNRRKKTRACQKCSISFIGSSSKKYCDACGPLIKLDASKKGGSASANKQRRRSKNEIYFSELCLKEFSNIECNEPIFFDKNGGKWDADIIIHDYKIAVLWNGNWHYIQIGEKQSLSQVQSRDKIKLSVIKNNGYISYVVEDRGKENNKFVEEEFQKLLKFITINFAQ